MGVRFQPVVTVWPFLRYLVHGAKNQHHIEGAAAAHTGARLAGRRHRSRSRVARPCGSRAMAQTRKRTRTGRRPRVASRRQHVRRPRPRFICAGESTAVYMRAGAVRLT